MNEIIKDLKDILKANPWRIESELRAYVAKLEALPKEEQSKLRTLPQNNSIHLYLEKISQQLQNEGHTMQDVVQAIKRAEIIPTMLALKEVVWKPIQKIMYGIDSTTKLKKTGQIEKVHMVVDKFFAENFGATHPFPDGSVIDKENDMRNEAKEMSKENAIDYPENTLDPKF